MRIAHVITYLSADGAFGGPVAVATSQAKAQARDGHHVTVMAAWDGLAVLDLQNVDLELYRAKRIGKSLAGIYSIGLIRRFFQLRRRFDVVHIHLGRDLTTLPLANIAQLMRINYVLQPHGMVMPDRRLKARMVDAMFTKRVLRKARRVIHLTDREKFGLSSIVPLANLKQLDNAIDLSARPDFAKTDRNLSVIFLARLQARKRVLEFAEAALQILANGIDAEFDIIGPDEGQLKPLQHLIEQAGSPTRLRYRGAISQGESLGYLRRADVYVLPSRGEVFPMTVLEAISQGTPVVIGDDCGIADILLEHGAAAITDGSVQSQVEIITELLLSEQRRSLLAKNAWLFASREWSTQDLALKLDRLYE